MPDAAPTASLDEKIGQMLLAGFRGASICDGDVIAADLRERNLGAVILFDRDMTAPGCGVRNIESPEQVRSLVREAQRQAKAPLLVAIDQEGGNVARLGPAAGFPQTLSHEELGRLDDPSATFEHADGIAQALAALGINLNLAPVVDLDVHPLNPVIKGKGRSFHADPERVAVHAMEFVRAHRKHNVLACAKHFPGHGSAGSDTHVGLADVTAAWTEREMIPFQRLVEADLCDCIMTAHVFNRRLDGEHPATLSKRIITGMLRDTLGFEGLIVSDDMEMQAIAAGYSLERSLELAINAGVDLLCFGNNLAFNPSIVSDAGTAIARLVRAGRVPASAIDRAHERIVMAKKKAGARAVKSE